MLINGGWYLCEDGTVRPVIRGEIRTASGTWLELPFLIDTGADRTVICAAVLQATGLSTTSTAEQLAGIGGTAAASATIDTEIHLLADDLGPFAAFTNLESLDMSVLGRDLTNLFAVIVDRPRDLV